MRRLPILIVLLLVHALPVRAAEGETALPPEAEELLEARVARGIAPFDPEDLYRRLSALDALDPAIEHLDAVAADEAAPPDRRRAAEWVAGGLLARRGDLQLALNRVQRVARPDGPLAPRLFVARLLDRAGRIRETREAYESLLEAALPAPEEERIRLRLVLLSEGRDDQAVRDLVAWAQERDGFRNRAGLVLALLGRAKEALVLYRADGEGKERFREEVRLADIALAAEDPALAGEHAWEALGAATVGRDRRYALSLLVEVARAQDALPLLIERFTSTPDLSEDARKVWIDLLRETGRADEALALFRESANGNFTRPMRRELLEICREAGREEILVDTYREMIADEPEVVEWREGLARHFLERGDTEAARGVFSGFLEDGALADRRLAAARALMDLGLDGLAIELAEANLSEGRDELPSCLFLFTLHRIRGRMERAEEALRRMDGLAPEGDAGRRELAEAWERIGRRDEAVRILSGLREALGPEEAAEDLDMRLAWLLSETGEDEEALDLWRELRGRIESVARRRYVEDRLLAAASRLGKLADVAIELEEKIADGEATPRDTGLLVRLYTKANDAVSAAEIVEEAAKISGEGRVKTLVEKARVFLVCTDYHSYEETIRELIEVDPEGKADYLRQLAMSQLERGKPAEARDVLAELRKLDEGSDSAEFEAGVLALAGLREEAIEVYREGIAAHPDRIESYLLMGNLMAEVGRGDRAVGMFQHLAGTAERDDLFTVAIDGLLNLSAPPAAMNWARRTTIERLSGKPDRMYLYQLLADLSEEVADREMQMRAIAVALPAAGEQRMILLRELMDLTARRSSEKDRHLAWGRRLLGLGEIAPPQVFLDLGSAFLANGEVTNAAKTFALATEVPDWASFQRQVAAAFEQAGFLEHALRTWERLLVSRAGDVSLMLKVGELHEQLGRFDRAETLYGNAIDLLLSRRPFSGDAPDEETLPWYRNRNVDEYDQYYALALSSLLANLDPDEADARVAAEREKIGADLERAKEAQAKAALEADDDEDPPPLGAYPRLAARADHLRRLAFAFGRVQVADGVDALLLAAFPDDPDLLEKLVLERAAWGQVAGARRLIGESGRDEEERTRVGYLVGIPAESGAEGGGFLPPGEAVRLLLPSIADGDMEPMRELLRRVDMTEIAGGDIVSASLLLAAASDLGDGDVALRLARSWLAGAIRGDEQGTSSWTVTRTLDRFESALDPERFRILADYVVSLVLDEPGPNGRWLSLIPRLQASFEDPLLDRERIDKLLENVEEAGWVYLGQLFTALPEEDRGRALRAMLAKVAPSQRLWFITEMLGRMEGDAKGDLADLLVASFRQALEEMDRNDPFALNGFTRLTEAEGNIGLKLRIARAAREKVPDNQLVRANLAVLLARSGKVEEGLEEGLAVWSDLLAVTNSDWTLVRARSLVQQEFLAEHADRFLEVLRGKAEEGAAPLFVTQRRLEIVRQTGEPEDYLAALRQAVEDHPDETGFLSTLANEVYRRQSAREAIELFERLRELEPDNDYYRGRVVRIWLGLRNPIRALAALEKDDEGEEPEPEEEAERTERVTIQQVKEAVDEGRTLDARLLWRRLWRGFRSGLRTPYPGAFLNPPVRYRWPPDREEPEEESAEEERFRGGLSGFRDVVPPSDPAEGAYETIARTEFGLAEIERQVRTWSGPQLAAATDVIDALAVARAERRGRDEVVTGILERVADGVAGNLENAVLLALIESDPEAVGERDAAALADLVRTLEPDQAEQIRRLARVQASLGQAKRAARLYRWCGTLSSLGVVRQGNRSVISGPGNPSDLVHEVAEVLTGDLRSETIEAIFALSVPAEARGFSGFDRNRYEALVLEIWEDVLGPEAALTKTRAICEDLTTTESGLRREAAKRAAVLWARAGEVARALACLEHALLAHEMPPDAPAWQRWQWQRSNLSDPDIRRLFPAEPDGWAQPELWFRVAGTALRDRAAEERIPVGPVFRAVAILALRLNALGAEEAAADHLDWLAETAGDDPDDLLWVVDVARELGRDERADRIERDLLLADLLHVERIPEALARLRGTDGDEKAFEVGNELLGTTLHPRLLDLVQDLARALGKTERAAEIARLREEAEAATEKLEAEN